MKKTHLHSEQFDGHLHAVCCTIKNEDKAKIVGGGDQFEDTPYDQRCRKCSEENWPNGGEPR